jgi:hypothetical protein
MLDGGLLSTIGETHEEPSITWARNDTEACEYMTATAWHSYLVREHNELVSRVGEAKAFRGDEWNNIASDARRILQNEIEAAANRLGLVSSVQKEFISQARWDLVHSVIEHAYNQIVTPGWYTLIERAYIAGHIVCGREGENCDGNLVLY